MLLSDFVLVRKKRQLICYLESIVVISRPWLLVLVSVLNRKYMQELTVKFCIHVRSFHGCFDHALVFDGGR